MPQEIEYTTAGLRLTNPDWLPADKTFYAALGAARGNELTYDEKQAYFNRFNALGGVGAFNLTASADGITLTSDLLAGVNVPALSMDGQMRYAGQDFRKGNPGDTQAQQIASNTITLLNGLQFYNGQPVTIIKGA